MSEPFLGEIKIISWNFPPKGWAFCNGQLMQINQNQALFALLGTMYGGNGQTTFALPDFRGRTPIHVGDGYTQGQRGGETAHTLIISEMPAHNHIMNGTSVTGTLNQTTSNTLGVSQTPVYNAFNSPTTLAPDSVTNVGGSQPHENMMPYLVLNFIIALQGIFPSRN
jgi:microcystin-dependent protein